MQKLPPTRTYVRASLPFPQQTTSSHLNLQGFQRDFARLYHRNQLAAVANHPLTFTNSPSLTAPWMSLALHSLSRQHKDHRYDNDIYRLALLRRLRLPLLPSELHDTACTCGKPLDPFGDHIFYLFPCP
jgi:hypothetical protein